MTMFFKDSDFYIFDEPVGAMDPDSRILFYELIEKLKNKKKTILIVSHILDELKYATDEYVFLKNGEILKVLPTAEVGNNALKYYKKIIRGEDISTKKVVSLNNSNSKSKPQPKTSTSTKKITKKPTAKKSLSKKK
jgi:ABC-type multidrug transport system ATPase subunit